MSLDLIPLLAPYKKKGRLSLRLERLPQGVRLSAGRNRGDGMWSLASDELEDLKYLMPDTVHDTHTIGIRVISLDGDAGSTLALLDYVVSPSAAEEEEDDAEEAEVPAKKEPAPAAAPAPKAKAKAENGKPATLGGAELGDLALLNRLRGELAVKGSLLLKEPEPAPEEPAHLEFTKEKFEAKLAAARAVWKAELDERLAVAAVDAAAALAKAREEWEAEQGTKRTAREKTEAELARARAIWKAELDKQLAEAASTAAQELAKARETWEAERAADAARTATEDSAKSEKAKGRAEADLAKARTEWEAELERRLEQAHENATAEIAAAREAWEAERTAQVVKLTKTESAKGKIEGELAAARATWKAELEERLAESATDAAVMVARQKRASDAEQAAALAKAEEAALAALEEQRALLTKEAESALAKAEEAWTAAEAERTNATEAEWQERMERALAESHAEARAEKKHVEENEIRPLRERIAALEGTVAERDAALAKACLDTDDARSLWQRDMADALSRAEEATKTAIAEGNAKLAEKEAEWQERSTKDRAAAEALIDEANIALTAVKAKAEAEATAFKAQVEVDTAAASAKATAELAAANAKATADLAAANAKADVNLRTAHIKAEDDTRDLRAEIETLKATIAERDRTFDQYKQDIAAARARDDADWKADAATQLETIEAKTKRQYSGALADATARADAAEAALALIRHKAARDQSHDHGDTLEINRLRDELSALQRTLANREKELAQFHGEIGNPHDVDLPDMKIALRTNEAWKRAEQQEAERRAKKTKGKLGYVFAGVVVIGAIAGGVFMFTGSDQVQIVPPPAATETETDAGGEHTTSANQRTATVEKDSNLRAGPSTTTAVAGSVKRGMTVVIVDAQGNWRKVRFTGATPGQTQEGWVHNSRLKEAPATRAGEP